MFEEQEIVDLYTPYFVIPKYSESYKHIDKNGRTFKRRTVSVYMERGREIKFNVLFYCPSKDSPPKSFPFSSSSPLILWILLSEDIKFNIHNTASF